MRADARRIGRAVALALAGVLFGTPSASAQGIYGTLQLQFQRSDEEQVVLGDSTRRSVRVARSQWLRSLDLHQQNYLRRDLLLDSNMRVSEVLQGESNDLSRTPQGSLRLLHPMFQISLSHQPTLTRTTAKVSPFGTAGTVRDTTPTVTTTTHFRETLLNGHFANARLPQLDVSWSRRQREQDAGGATIAIGDRSTQRNVRLSLARSRWGGYLSNSDQRQVSGIGQASTQAQWSGGFNARMPVRRDLGFNVQYDGSTVRSRFGDLRDSRISTQNAGVDGDWRPDPHYGASLRYQMSSTASGAATPRHTDHEGSLLLRLIPSKIASLTAGGGVRTARTIANAPALQRYLTSIGTIQGKVRGDWTATGSASHTTSWDPEAGTSSVQTVSGSTVMAFGRRTHLDGSLQFSRNGGIAATDQRYANVWMLRLQCAPLRSIDALLTTRSTRVGPTLLAPSGIARGAGIDLHVRPTKPLELLGSWSTSGSLPNDKPRSTARSATVRWARSVRWQLDGGWSKTTSPGSFDGALPTRDSESQNLRLQWTPSRRVAMSGNVTRRDPGRVTETRQFDAVFVWSFGR